MIPTAGVSNGWSTNGTDPLRNLDAADGLNRPFDVAIGNGPVSPPPPGPPPGENVLAAQALAEPVAHNWTPATSSKTTATDAVLADDSINWLAYYYWQEHSDD